MKLGERPMSEHNARTGVDRGTSRHCRRRELRVLAGTGRAVLPGRRREQHRARPDAREVRPVPRPRREVRGRLRRGRQEGRLRPVGGDLRVGEQHDQDRRRAAHQRDRAARPDARRHRQVLRRHHRDVRRRARRRGQGAQGRERRRAGVLPAGGLRGGRQVLRPVRHRRRRGVRQRAAGVHRLGPGVGQEVRRRRACRSSATTSRARSAPPSPTA